jgi:L-lactate dehydrogenase complex protein LldE
MRVGLFVPCYIDQLYPKVAIATLQFLEKLGLDVVYPENQTCCGQPMANAGFEHTTKAVDKLFMENFMGLEYVVSPSGSCVLHVKHQLHSKTENITAHDRPFSIFELTEFLTDILKINTLKAHFPFKVGLHQSCHGQRGLGLSQMSEIVGPSFSKSEQLLKMVSGLELVQLDRQDECCGFGGTFCVAEEAVSVKMGKDRIQDHSAHGVEVITGSDMSCLMHLEGILRRQRSNIKVSHIAEILNSNE